MTTQRSTSRAVQSGARDGKERHGPVRLGRERQARHVRASHQFLPDRSQPQKPPARVYIGQVFGRLIVQAFSHKGRWRAICVCECGNEISVRVDNLLLLTKVTCGCDRRHRSPRESFLGRRFDRWEVIDSLGTQELGQQRFWICVCDCGELRPVSHGSLSTGRSRSCGCLKKEPRIWTRVSPEKRSETRRLYRSRMTDGRMASLLGMQLAKCPSALIELKREHLRLVRLIKEMKK